MGNHNNRTDIKEALKNGYGETVRMSIHYENRLIIMR